MKRMLCLHGIGGKDATMATWSRDWKNALIKKCGDPSLKFLFLKTDDLFHESRYRMDGIQYIQAIRLCLSSWMSAAREKRFRDKAFLDAVRLYAGMPAQFITDSRLRFRLRNRLENALLHFQPTVVFAHSLGTLITYDLLRSFRHPLPLVLVTSGSPLSHPALNDLYGGPLQPLPVQRWINLHNRHDRLFASRRLNIRSANFIEEETPFEYGSLNHDALHYIAQSKTAWLQAVQKDIPIPAGLLLHNR